MAVVLAGTIGGAGSKINEGSVSGSARILSSATISLVHTELPSIFSIEPLQTVCQTLALRPMPNCDLYSCLGNAIDNYWH